MIKKRLKSFKYAFEGFRELISSQPNAKIHLLVGLLTIVAGLLSKLSSGEWTTLILTITIVLAAEAFNTALEYLTDLASPEYHPLAKKTKDVAAAGVLVCAIGAVCVGLVIFGPRLVRWMVEVLRC